MPANLDKNKRYFHARIIWYELRIANIVSYSDLKRGFEQAHTHLGRIKEGKMKRFSFVPETNGDLRRARVSQVCSVFVIALLVVFTLILGERGDSVRAQSSDPTMTVPNLAVRTATSGLITP